MSETRMAVIDREKYTARTTALRSLADTLFVGDASSCLEAKKAQQEIRLEIKIRKTVLDPFVLIAKKNLDDAKEERAKWIDPLESIDGDLGAKVKEFERIEREFAAAEERRINEERRIKAEADAKIEREAREKQAKIEREAREREIEAARKAGDIKKREADRLAKEAREAEERERARAKQDEVVQAANVVEVKVAPSIPTVAGVPSRRNWKFTITDESRLPREYLMPDMVKIGEFVRRNKKAGEVIPGVTAYED